MTSDRDADGLYRLPPEDFTAARDELTKAAKAAGAADEAKVLKALRKPSVSAWLVNVLVDQQSGLVEQLLALGPALAEAQAQGQGDALRTLGAQRRELVDAVAQKAVALAARSITAAVRDEVASTLETALADPAAAQAVRSGRLVRALSYAGFGGVDLDGAVATAMRGAAPKPKSKKGKAPDTVAEDERRRRIAGAEAAALHAAGRLDDAVRACEQAEQQRAAAEASATQAQEEVVRLRDALAAAERSAAAAETGRKKAAATADAAVDAVRRTQRTEEAARAELDRLRRG